MNAVAEKAKRISNRTHVYRGVEIMKWASTYEFKVETFFHTSASFGFYRDKNSQLKLACQEIDIYLDKKGMTVNNVGNLMLPSDEKENRVLAELERQTVFLRKMMAILDEEMAKHNFVAARDAINLLIPTKEAIAKLNELLLEI